MLPAVKNRNVSDPRLAMPTSSKRALTGAEVDPRRASALRLRRRQPPVLGAIGAIDGDHSVHELGVGTER